RPAARTAGAAARRTRAARDRDARAPPARSAAGARGSSRNYRPPQGRGPALDLVGAALLGHRHEQPALPFRTETAEVDARQDPVGERLAPDHPRVDRTLEHELA